MTWTVKMIREDDYGCEERSLEDLDRVRVLLEDQKGGTLLLTSSDSLLRGMGIDEGDEWPEDLLK